MDADMRALVLDAEAKTAVVEEVSSPDPALNEILVHVEAISLNPIDPLCVAHPLAGSGRIIGSDFAGKVTAVGSQVPEMGIIPGDRVAGFLQGACSVNERPGAFAEYLVIPWDLVWKVPDAMAIEEAAGVSLVALTAAQSIWYRLGLEAPFTYNEHAAMDEHQERRSPQSKNRPEVTNILVYGASTSVGLYAAQMARLSAKTIGQKVKLHGVASTARWSMLSTEPHNYDHLVDYRNEDWQKQIQAFSTGVEMHFVYDTISEGDTVQRSASTMTLNGRIAIVRSREGGAWKAENLPTEPVYGAVWEGLGEKVQYQGLTVEKSPTARDFAVQFYRWLSMAIGSDLKPVTIRLMPGGLDKVVEDGFVLLGTGSMKERVSIRKEDCMRPVSAEKLVYVI
ncbi:hypothetical protein N0V94_004550 [Neodidymelliopsis sp. IMI 364377]|nr:hypothetical protein N0V94_004550 [Neodidymelliopsis sp. IMI 364377]